MRTCMGRKPKQSKEVRGASHGGTQVVLELHARSLHNGHKLSKQVQLEVHRDEFALAVPIGKKLKEDGIQRRGCGTGSEPDTQR